MNAVPAPAAALVGVQVAEKDHLSLQTILDDAVNLAARPEGNISFPVLYGTGEPINPILIHTFLLMLADGVIELLKKDSFCDAQLPGQVGVKGTYIHAIIPRFSGGGLRLTGHCGSNGRFTVIEWKKDATFQFLKQWCARRKSRVKLSQNRRWKLSANHSGTAREEVQKCTPQPMQKKGKCGMMSVSHGSG